MAQKPVIHGRDHLPGGADPIPTIEAASGSVLPTAFVTLAIAASSPQTVLGDGTPMSPDWSNAIGAGGYTNDASTITGYQTEDGGGFDASDLAWVGDNFEYDPDGFDLGTWGNGIVPLKIRADRPGVYLVTVGFALGFGTPPGAPFDAWFATFIQPDSVGAFGTGALTYKISSWQQKVWGIDVNDYPHWPHFDSIVVHRTVTDGPNVRSLGFRPAQNSGEDGALNAQMAIVRLNSDPA